MMTVRDDAIPGMIKEAFSALEVGRDEAAIALCRQVLDLRPNEADAMHLLGLAFKRRGLLAESIACFERLIALYPGAAFLATVRGNYGNALREAGRVFDALTQYRLALESTPHSTGLYNSIGNAFKDLGQWQEAEAAYRKALEYDPGNADALNNLGGAELNRGHHHEAVKLFRQALAIQPNLAQSWYNLGNALNDLSDFAASVDCLQKAVDLDPDHVEALSCLVRLKEQCCDWPGLDALRGRMIDRVRIRQDGRIYPFAFLSMAESNEDQFMCDRDWAHAQYDVMTNIPGRVAFSHEVRPHERLRIGYLSSDLHGHATAILMAEVFELHSRDRFEIIAYSAGPNDGSPMRQRLLQAFDAFNEVGTLSPQAIAEKIHADRIDILVDLKGYTRETRTAVLAFRPAPVQVAYLGFPGTLGADIVDYMVTDRFVTPLDQAQWFSEKFAYMPDCYQCNDRRRELAETLSRTEYGLPESALVLCCFNHSYKITPQIFDVWCRILQRLPESVLWLLASTPMTEDNLRDQARARGVDPARLYFAKVLPLPEHLARLRQADLFLDTLPVNAHTTTSDALWAGLPVITCAGNTFVSRVAGSLLQAVGLSECITTSLDAYFELACELGRHPERLKAMRERLADREKLPLFNTPRFVRGLEMLYQAMWQRRLQGLPPEHMLAQLAD
jgi:predicted O-linked N-acetylglucosamine transferase (SPINDLY family)